MNSALIYLLKRNFINQLKNLKKSPGKIAFLVIFIIVLLNSLLSAFYINPKNIRDLNELYALIFGFFSIIFIVSMPNGVDNGNSAFLMADINILFVSPLSQKDIFTYGIIKSIGSSILASVFLLYQFPYLRMNYGLSLVSFFVLFISFAFYMFIYQLCLFYIYTFVSSDDKKTIIAKSLLYLPFVLILLYLIFLYFGSRDFLASSILAANLQILDYLPVVGWSVAIAKYFIAGSYLKSLVFFVIDLVFFILIYILISKKNTDFYEDVIASAKNNEKLKKTRKSGVKKEKFKNRKIKSKKSFGDGVVSVFFSINRLLNKRSSALFINTSSLVTIAFTLIFTFLIKGSTDLNYITAMSVYMALVVYSNSRFDYHIKKHFIYLIPEKPFKKLIALIIPEIYTFFIETVIIYLAVVFLSDNSVFLVFIYGLLRMSYTILIISTNILVKKIIGPEGSLAKMTFVFLGLLILLVPSALGLILAINTTIYLGIALSTLLALLLSFILIFIGKNIISFKSN